MGVTVIKESYESRDAEINDDGTHTYIRKFHVHTDNARTSGPEIFATTAAMPDVIPRWGDPYPGETGNDLTSRAIRFKARPNKAMDLWVVEVTYGSRRDDQRMTGSSASGGDISGVVPAGGGDGTLEGGGAGGGSPADATQASPQIIENPLLRPAEVSWALVGETKVCPYDINGDPILNRAGQSYDPPPMKEEKNLKLTIVKNKARFDALAMRGYAECVNESTWLGFPAGTMKLSDLSAQRVQENGYWFWKVTYVFENRRSNAQQDGWMLRLLNQGMKGFKPGTTEIKAVTDRGGRPLSRPVPLDADGSWDPENPPTPVYDDWEIFFGADFKDLELF